MSEKMKPCPFCGCNPQIECTERGTWELACENLNCGYFGDYYETYEEAVEFWNTRKEEK